MRILSFLFILLAIAAFLAGILSRYSFIDIKNDPITLVEVSHTSLLFAIAFGILSLKR